MDLFKKVRSIALYDAGVLLQNVDCEDIMHGMDNGFGAWTMLGQDIADIARVFAIPFGSVGSGKGIRHLADMEFKVYREYHLYGGDFGNSGKILDIEARIDGPQMLDIRVLEKWAEDEHQMAREFSYHGRFSVEWD
jgi:hypothetical protein